MNRVFLLLVLAVSLLFSSCGSLPLSAEAKKRYLDNEKMEADAYAFAEVNCREKLIDKRMLETRSDMSLSKQKNENFKFRLAFTKYIDAKFEGHEEKINELYNLMEELGPELETCRKAEPVEAVETESN